MDIERLEKKGIKAYKALIDCVNAALEEESSEYAVICALPLIKLAVAEGANYFGSEDPSHPESFYYNHRTAINVAKEAVKFAEKEGVSSWLEDDLEEIKKIIKEI